ncbi:MAG TPA: hypothetical protein VKT71_13070 [Candidatus Acidoferrales bacterium]|nr:hypothetical protein [Candidatus Acidoferrales bacterium]
MHNRLFGLCGLSLALAAALSAPRDLPAQGEKSSTSKVRPASAPVDLSGVWRRSRRPPDQARKYTIYELAFSITNDPPPMTSWAEAKFKANKPNVGPRAVSIGESNDPVLQCAPPGVPRVYLIRGEPVEIAHIPGRVLMLFEYDHFVRNIYTDGRPHPADLNPSWMGDAIGKWEGDTLVVDTIGFNDKTWVDNDGHPHSEDLHVIERIRRVNHDTLTIDTTIEDPKAYTKPWGGHAVYELKTGWNLGEMVCEDNVTYGDMQQKSEGKK